MKVLVFPLLALLVAISAQASGKDPLQAQVDDASREFEQATRSLEAQQRKEAQGEKKLADCKDAACERKESDRLAADREKTAQSEEAVADAAGRYIDAEEAYRSEHGAYRDPDQVREIQRAMELAQTLGGGDGYQDPTGNEKPTGDALKDYKISTPEIGGGREIDPRNHTSYDKGTRDPGIVNLEDDSMSRYAAAASEAGQGDELDLPPENRGGTVGGPLLAGSGALAPGDAIARSRGRSIADGGSTRQSHGVAGLPRPAVAPFSGDGIGGRKPLTQRDPRRAAVREKLSGHLRAGRQKINARDYIAAYGEAKQAIAADKSDPAGWLLMAKAASGMAAAASGSERTRRFQDAERAAREAIRAGAGGGEAYRELAFAQLHLGKNSEAVDAATRAIELDGSDARAYALRAFAYEGMGMREAMLRDLKRAAAIDPNRFDGLLRDALAGKRVFDPNARDSRRLLDAMAASGRPSGGDGPPLVLLGILLMGCAASGLLAAWAWRRLRAEEGPHQPAPAVPVSAPEPAAAERSKLLAGKYELKRTIGRGAWGQVWEALDCSLGRMAAVKQIETAQRDANGSGPQLHLKEARTLASMQHPNIVDIYEVLETPQGVFLVFEMLEGKTLQQLLAERKTFSPLEARSILGAVASALATAHANNIVHRDLKPANIMVTNEGHVKVMDFGIARAIGEVGDARGITPHGGELLRTEQTSHWVGTPGYRPPEAERGVVSAAFDIYSLGVCVFEMLVGRRPYTAPGETDAKQAAHALAAALPGISPQALALWQRLVEPDFESRIASVPEFVEFLNLLAVPSTEHSGFRN